MKVLVYSEAWGKGGIESFVCGEISALQSNGYQFDVFTTWCWEGLATYVTDAYGVVQYAVYDGYRPNLTKRIIRGAKAFGELLATKHYDAVHINTMNGSGFVYSWVAKRHGVPTRIVHSHNSDVGAGAKAAKRVISRALTSLFGNTATVRLACSEDAGRYLFGDRPFQIVNNGIDTERFRYKAESREVIRLELGIPEGTTLLGNIGRIAPAKNPLFQLDVFAEYLKLDPDARYLMLGGGELLDEVRAHAKGLGIERGLIIHEPVVDTAPWYCALDAFLMPSLYEGLGIVRIEAQCSGLSVLISDGQPREGDLTGLSTRLSLDASPGEWAAKLYEMTHFEVHDRGAYANAIREAGYGREQTISTMELVLRGES